MAAHNELGKKGEQLALEYLLNKGYRVLEKNYRHGKAEVDLILEKDNLVIFAEVKTRTTSYFGNPEESISTAKQKLLIEAADHYMNSTQTDAEVRFDAIAIIISKKEFSISHIEDAFYPMSE